MLQPHPTWDVKDSTKIKAYKTCPRLYFYEFMLGWRSRFPNHDLWYGISVHSALEHIYKEWKDNGVRYTNRVVMEGYEVFLTQYREKFAPSTDIEHKHKNPSETLIMLSEYVKHYSRDDFEVVYTEISGSVPISRCGKRIFFRLDTLCRDERGFFILEHKTSAWDQARWQASLRQSTQVGVGNHLLFCLYGDKAWGVLLNGLFLTRPKSYEQEDIGRFFVRVPMRRDMRRMEDWRVTAERWYDDIERETNILLNEDNAEKPVMAAFPKNEHGCMAYNRLCRFADYCTAWPNPLARCHTCPEDFIVEFWDPRSLDKANTTKVEL